MTLGKNVDFVFKGETTEISYTFHNIIKEMLVILINNAVSHAIQLPDERVKNGKSETGRIEVSIERHDTDMVITVADDGEGINEEEISKNFALAGSNDLWEIISAPSFSTSAGVDGFSGRGNGLAFVRETVEHFNGVVRLLNKRGKGLTFHITIPLSTSLIKIFTAFTGQCSAAFITSEITEKLPFGDKYLNFNNLMPKFNAGHLKITLQGKRNIKALFNADAVAPESRENVHILPSRLKEIIPVYGAYIREGGYEHTPVLSASVASKMFILKRAKIFKFEHRSYEDLVYLRRDNLLFSVPLQSLSTICSSRSIVEMSLKFPQQLSGMIMYNGIVVPVLSFGDESVEKEKMIAIILFSNDAAVGLYINEIMSSADYLENKSFLTLVSEKDFLGELEQQMTSVREFYLKLLADGEIFGK